MISRILVALGILYILAVVFGPQIPASEMVRIDDILLAIAVPITAYRFFRRRSFRIRTSNLLIAIAGFIIALVIMISAIANSNLLMGNPEGFYKELLRLTKYGLVAFVFSDLALRSRNRIIIGTVIAAGLATVAIQLIQYASGPAFSQLLADIYGGEVHYEVSISQTARAAGRFYAGGTFANPNIAGAFLIIPFALAFNNLLKPEMALWNKATNFRRLVILLITVTLILGILITRSRTTMVATIAVIITLIVINVRLNQTLIIVIMISIIAIVLLLLIRSQLSGGISLIQEFRDGFEVGGSIYSKSRWFRDAFADLIEQNLLLGFGPSNGPQVDFEYGYYVIWYGPLGIVAFFILWLTSLWSLIRYKSQFIYWQPTVAIIIGFLVMNISQTTYLTIKVFPIFVAIYFVQIIPMGKLARNQNNQLLNSSAIYDSA